VTETRFISSLPPEERDAYLCVSINGAALHRFISDFQLSVTLFEMLSQAQAAQPEGLSAFTFSRLRTIPAKDGALNVYHFGMSLSGTRNNIGRCRSILKHIDVQLLRVAARLFDSYFPNYELIRHAIAHTGELFDTPEKLRASMLKERTTAHGVTFGPGAIPSQAVSGSVYSIGIDGEMFSISIDSTSTEKLIAVNSRVDGAFKALYAHIATLSES
jgi:hypothetical protein